LKPIRVGLLGIGTVGGGTWEVLNRNAGEIRRRAGRAIGITQVADKDVSRARRIVQGFIVDTLPPRTDFIDVHANQYGLLRASPCFKNSITMTCNTCHNTHENERGNTVLFSQRCMNCHSSGNEKDCKLKQSLGSAITKNCIDCHMPLQPSRAISVRLQETNAPVSALIRSHFISIYPDEAKRIINELKKER
jgi:hypothetical protein